MADYLNQIETVTTQEGRDAIKGILARWNYCIRVAVAQGQTPAQAAETVGRYFTRMLETVNNTAGAFQAIAKEQGRLFTPRSSDTLQRFKWHISDADSAKIKRGHRWSATVTNLDDGKAYKVRGVPCSLHRCFCDAVVIGEE